MTRQPRDDPHDHTVYQVGSPGRSASHGSGNSQSSGSSGRNSADSLKQRQEKLQNELLHVTQKLVRKYSKQFFPPTNRGSPNKTKYLADQWSHDECLSEADKYKMYMDGRYATTTHLDYYARDLEARDADNNKHKHHTQHTKYGDAIVMNRYSLRGKF
ncbi:TPA: hypothetical protein N0F65_011790 [Lagenidium giganteum]|uniref:Uncharacterized protein n=1 Tax=Lagenidium giganteum TaxID=4803 RepID=A0AAV2YS54_9STRA|nr:TPA: hypothetical protein N0F65_011790 [Lagenidium giganteum]